MTPSKVFENPITKKKLSDLYDFSSNDVIRVLIALRQSNLHGGAQTYFIDGTSMDDSDSYALCLRGICKETVRGKQRAPHEYWSFLADGISRWLQELVDSAWWDLTKMIDADLQDRRKNAKEIAYEMPDDAVKSAAKHRLELIEYGDGRDAGNAVAGEEEMKVAARGM